MGFPVNIPERILTEDWNIGMFYMILFCIFSYLLCFFMITGKHLLRLVFVGSVSGRVVCSPLHTVGGSG